MNKLVSIVALFCLIQSIYGACPEGYFTSVNGADNANHGICTACLPVCKTCTDATSCTSFTSRVKGAETASTIKCQTGSVAGLGGNDYAYSNGYGLGYNANINSCVDCKAGCEICAVDYDICYSCYAGWDFDEKNLQCVRATLGLAAVVLALSVLVLIVGIITCVLACKLS